MSGSTTALWETRWISETCGLPPRLEDTSLLVIR